MNKVKIIADSCSDLTRELYTQNDIDVAALSVLVEGKNRLDGVDIDPKELFESVKRSGELPQTAGVRPQVFEELFKKYIDEGYDIVYIGLGSGLSTTFQNSRIAAMDLPEDRVFLIDSQNLSTGIGLLVLKACKLRDEGKSAAEIADEVNKLIPNVVAQFTVDTLEYLHKGGRCSGASKLIGHIFHVHPYIQVQNGSMVVYKKPRGPMKLAVIEQINELKSALPNVDTDNIFITHSTIEPELLEFAKAELAKLVPAESIKVTTAGCVISSHCGPGCVGILYIKK